MTLYQMKLPKRRCPSFSSSLSQPTEIVKEMEENLDRISNLPESLLLQILSAVPTKYAVRTDILSKGWQGIWKEIFNLDLDEDTFMEIDCPQLLDPHAMVRWALEMKNQQRSRFVEFVQGALHNYSGNKISKFRIRISYYHMHSTYVEKWLKFAIEKGIEELDLDFSPGRLEESINQEHDQYFLPEFLFVYESLSVLKLNCCTVKPVSLTMFRMLENLTLAQVMLSSDVLSEVLTSCLFLKMLYIEKCLGLAGLVIQDRMSSLESLTIIEFGLLSPCIDIRTPNLKTFKYCGPVPVVPFHFEKMPLLYEVELDFDDNSVFPPKIQFGKLFGVLDHVRVLTVFPYLIQVLPTEENVNTVLPTPLCKLRHLNLKIGLHKFELPGIACLLRSSPMLETLYVEFGVKELIHAYVHLDFVKVSSGNQSFWESQAPICCLSNHLKYVEVNGFAWQEIEIDLLMFLLRNAMALERLTINKQTQGTSTGEDLKRLKSVESILAGAKASSAVRIVVY